MIIKTFQPKPRDTPYTMLAAAIVERAVMDYRKALIRCNAKAICSLERFFRSEWFAMLSDLDVNLLLRIMKEELS